MSLVLDDSRDETIVRIRHKNQLVPVQTLFRMSKNPNAPLVMGTTVFPEVRTAKFRLTESGAADGRFLSCDANGVGSWVAGVTPATVTTTGLTAVISSADRATGADKITMRLMKFNNMVFCHIFGTGSLATGQTPAAILLGGSGTATVAAAYRPAGTIRLATNYLDNAAWEAGTVTVTSGGVVTIENSIAADDSTFTLNSHLCWAVGTA